ncbi:MAG: hypothetical protein HY898_07325 [Deltaproteobacteria bacterium]|nr:hypothetical protein [Deltaproteobacteria bacterium]
MTFHSDAWRGAVLVCLLVSSCAPAPAQQPVPRVQPIVTTPVPSATASAPLPCEASIAEEIAKSSFTSHVHAPGEAFALSALFPAPQGRAKPTQPPMDLGRMAISPVAPTPLSPMDVSWRTLPPEIVERDLPAADQAAFRAFDERRKALQRTFIQRNTIDRKVDVCRRASCPELACLQSLAVAMRDRQMPGARSEADRTRDAAIQTLDRLEANPATASRATVQLALAKLLWEKDQAAEDPKQAPARVMALLQSASQLAPATEPVGWYARYFLGMAHSDARRAKEALAAFKALDGVAPPPRVSPIEAAYRIAEATDAPANLAAWRHAVDGCPARLTEIDVPICLAAAYQWMGVEYATGAWRSSIDAAARVLSWMEQAGDEGADLRSEATTVLVDSLDLFGGESIGNLPSVPRKEIRALGELVARKAMDRFDTATAIQAWDAAHPSHDASRPTMKTVSARDEVDARVRRLLASCALSNPATDLDFRIEGDASGKVKVSGVKGRGGIAPALLACLSNRAPWFLRGAPGGYKALVRIDM